MNLISAIDQIIFFSNNLKNEEDAYNLYKGLYINEVIKSLESKNLHNFFFLEDLGFRLIIKKFDNEKHNNRCLKIFDEVVDSFFSKNFFEKKFCKSLENKIAFHIHNMSNFLAHTEVFSSFLKNIDKEKFKEYRVYIFTSTILENVDYRIRHLCEILNINIISFISENHYTYFQKIINFYVQNKFKNLIFLSVVKGISFLSKSLPDNVSWFVMRHSLDSFKNLKHIYAPFKLNQNKLDLAGNTKVFYFKDIVNLECKFINVIFPKKRIKFYTINREEKINNKEFLNFIKEILCKFPESTFSWTGRQKDQIIENFFKKNNLGHRVSFLGWIDIYKFGIKHGDIFLDTPNVSGLIAAKCFASGIPTVFFNNSSFWLNRHLNSLKEDIKNDNLYNFIEQEIISDWYKNSNDTTNYLFNIINKLVTNENYFKNYINLSIKLANKYFNNPQNKREANLLFENMFS